MIKSTAVSIALIATVAVAHAETPIQIVEEITEEAQVSLADSRISETEMMKLLEDVDVDGIARIALGKYAKRVHADAYGDYETAFRAYLKIQLQDHLARFSGGDLNTVDTTSHGRQTIVETRVTKSDGETIDVNWRLRRSSDTWEIIDIEAMNLWLAIEQRAQFTAELDQNNGDVNALISTLKAKS